MKIYQFLLIALLASCAYDPGDGRLEIINLTKHDIAVFWSPDTIPEYPSINDTEIYLRNQIMAGNAASQPADDGNWPKFVRNSFNNKLNLFIYNIDTLKAYNSIDTLIIKKLYRRLEYSMEELDQLDWKIKVQE